MTISVTSTKKVNPAEAAFRLEDQFIASILVERVWLDGVLDPSELSNSLYREIYGRAITNPEFRDMSSVTAWLTAQGRVADAVIDIGAAPLALARTPEGLRGIARAIRDVRRQKQICEHAEHLADAAYAGNTDDVQAFHRLLTEALEHGCDAQVAIPDLATFDAEIVPYLIDGLMPAEHLIMLAGTDGCGKSALALRLGWSVSKGALFLGRRCQKTRVYYLDRENPLSEAQKRRLLLSESGNPDFLWWGSWRSFPEVPDLEAGFSTLLTLAREERPLLIFDTLAAFTDGDENDKVDVQPVMQKFRRLTGAGATVVFLHHTGKGQGSEYRGNSAIRAAVDMAFLLEQDEMGLLTLRHTKNRTGGKSSIAIRPCWDVYDFQQTDSPAVTSHQEDLKKLAEIIQASPGLTQKAICDQAHMKRVRVIDLLKTPGLWRIEKEGRAYRYYTCSPVPTCSRNKEQVEGTCSPVPTPLGGNREQPQFPDQIKAAEFFYSQFFKKSWRNLSTDERTAVLRLIGQNVGVDPGKLSEHLAPLGIGPEKTLYFVAGPSDIVGNVWPIFRGQADNPTVVERMTQLGVERATYHQIKHQIKGGEPWNN
jgi:archaellum biogenesis ATPase FlaH